MSTPEQTPETSKRTKRANWVQRLVRLCRRVSFDRLGVEFPWNGDTVIWLWWWKRNRLPKYISVGLSGNGDFGDARFHTLAGIDAAWDSLGDIRNMPFSA
jgi:hypothetical protein